VIFRENQGWSKKLMLRILEGVRRHLAFGCPIASGDAWQIGLSGVPKNRKLPPAVHRFQETAQAQFQTTKLSAPRPKSRVKLWPHLPIQARIATAHRSRRVIPARAPQWHYVQESPPIGAFCLISLKTTSISHRLRYRSTIVWGVHSRLSDKNSIFRHFPSPHHPPNDPPQPDWIAPTRSRRISSAPRRRSEYCRGVPADSAGTTRNRIPSLARVTQETSRLTTRRGGAIQVGFIENHNLPARGPRTLPKPFLACCGVPCPRWQTGAKNFAGPAADDIWPPPCAADAWPVHAVGHQ